MQFSTVTVTVHYITVVSCTSSRMRNIPVAYSADQCTGVLVVVGSSISRCGGVLVFQCYVTLLLVAS